MGVPRRHRRVMSWLAAIALLSNALAMAAFAPSTAGALVDAILGPVVLCTADGAKVGANGGSGSGEHGAADHCAACITVSQFTLFVAILVSIIAFPLRPAARPARHRSFSLALHLSLGGVRPRAPPLLA